MENIVVEDADLHKMKVSRNNSLVISKILFTRSVELRLLHFVEKYITLYAALLI